MMLLQFDHNGIQLTPNAPKTGCLEHLVGDECGARSIQLTRKAGKNALIHFVRNEVLLCRSSEFKTTNECSGILKNTVEIKGAC